MEAEIQEKDPGTGMKKLRKYELWEGNHIFYKNGRFLTGPKPRSLLICCCLLNITNLLSFGSTWVVSHLFSEILLGLGQR
jgi:hypothetical protein